MYRQLVACIASWYHVSPIGSMYHQLVSCCVSLQSIEAVALFEVAQSKMSLGEFVNTSYFFSSIIIIFTIFISMHVRTANNYDYQTQ